VATIFDNIITQGVRAGQIPARTDQARSWYRDTAKQFGRNINEKSLLNKDKTRLVSQIKPGNMYMFMYDPKFKDTLPYYDRFPLIFPFRVEGDRFWAINLHYLPHRIRAQLMDSLYDLVNNQRYDESTRIQGTFELLNRAARSRWIKPCVKQYLFSQMNSRFMYVYPSEWDIALFLPLERFSKATKSQVWAESKISMGK
jgi:hypothetical protein